MEPIQTVEQALAQMLARCTVTPEEAVALAEAHGSVLAADCASQIDLPPFNNSAVDGYAVRAADTNGASQSTPVRLPIAFQQYAGAAEEVSLECGTAARVMTGAPIPNGADAVIMQEDVTLIDDQGIQFETPIIAGEHFRKTGGDVLAGETVLTAGTLLGPAELGILAATGRSSARVHRRVRVGVVTTGDEVEDVGTPLIYGKIYNCNTFCLRALVERSGAEPVLLRHLPDEFDSTCDALKEIVSAGVDVIVCAGGVSVGAKDFVKPALERLGRMDLWRVSMKPGKPVAFGSIGPTLFFGLPGNPASVLVTFELFVRPCLWKMSGRRHVEREIVEGTVTDEIEHVPGRREYVRAWTSWQQGGYLSTTTGAQGSGRLRSLLGSNSLIIVPDESTGISAGTAVRIMLTGG